MSLTSRRAFHLSMTEVESTRTLFFRWPMGMGWLPRPAQTSGSLPLANNPHTLIAVSYVCLADRAADGNSACLVVTSRWWRLMSFQLLIQSVSGVLVLCVLGSLKFLTGMRALEIHSQHATLWDQKLGTNL